MINLAVTLFAPLVKRLRPPLDAGQELRRAELAGQLILHGDEPDTCQVELVRPDLGYTVAPFIAIEAWMHAWRITQWSRGERDHALRQDMVRLSAGVLVVSQLNLPDGDALLADVLRRVCFDEHVVVAHRWFLMQALGEVAGQAHYQALLAANRRADVEIEARLALLGIETTRAADVDQDDGRWV